MKHRLPVRSFLKHRLPVRSFLKHRLPVRSLLKHRLPVWIMLGAFVCALAATRPHIAERWALYLGNPATPGAARLFLDPFPDAGSCEATVLVFTANAERAFCSGRMALEFGTAADAVLAADFESLVPRAWYCVPPRRSH
jgi:hypothetical protein